MNRIFRSLGIGLLVVLMIIVVIGISLVLYNIEDDELEADVVRLLSETPHQITVKDNGYFAWIGVVGPDTMQPYEWGRRWFEEALQADRERKSPPLPIESEIQQDSNLAERIPCDKIEICLEEVAKRPTAVHKTLELAFSMLNRCDSAMDFSKYQEPWRPHLSFNSQFPHYQSTCRKLQATRFALAVAEKRDDEAIGQLEKEIAFHIRQMQGSITLLDKMIAMAYLRKDYLLLNQFLLKRPDLISQKIRHLTKLLAPLEANAISMATVVKTEWLFAARGFLDLPGLASSEEESDEGLWTRQGGMVDTAITDLFYLPNATVNEYYKWYRPIANLDRLSGESYRKALSTIENNHKTNKGGDLFGLTLRNPAGRILVQVAKPNFVRYFKVRDDLLALHAVIIFQLDLMDRGVINEDAIEQAVSKAQLLHPFTGETAIWDKSTRTLMYPTLPEWDDKSLAINL